MPAKIFVLFVYTYYKLYKQIIEFKECMQIFKLFYIFVYVNLLNLYSLNPFCFWLTNLKPLAWQSNKSEIAKFNLFVCLSSRANCFRDHFANLTWNKRLEYVIFEYTYDRKVNFSDTRKRKYKKVRVERGNLSTFVCLF